MVVTNFSDVEDVLSNLVTAEQSYTDIEITSNNTIRVLKYLPIEGKANLVQYVVNMAIDSNTGCFSPIRVNVYYEIGVLRSYCGIHFDDNENISEVYDLLVQAKVIDKVMLAIPEEERNYIQTLINDTIKDISRYNNSFAGMIASASGEAGSLDTTLQDILEKIKNREGLEVLSEIKNAVGTD